MNRSEPGLASRKAVMLRGVDLVRWGPLIDDARLDAALAEIDAIGDAARTAPPPQLVFEPLRYGAPEDISVVILGQDPYPTQGDAQGVCFSVSRGRALPDSLSRVFGCLDRAGLRAAREGVCGDIRAWAVQGVLMLNTALTTRVGVRGAHVDLWREFVGELVRRLCAEAQAAGRQIHFLLWGGAARAFAATARRHQHFAHEWTHPSPLADNRLPPAVRFRECSHFEEVNAALRAAGRLAITWDNCVPVIAFSDGSCPRNGAPDALAGFAAVVVGGPFRAGATIIRGSVAPFVLAAADPDDPESGLARTTAPATPTNNRAEYLGLIYCFLALLAGRVAGQVEVVSDSEVCVRTLLEYLPRRLARGTESGLANIDLVMAAWRLFSALRERASSVALTHVRGHGSEPPARSPARVRLLHRGNKLADAHAGAAIDSCAPGRTELLNAPPALGRLSG